MKQESTFNIYFMIMSDDSDFDVDIAKVDFSENPDIVRKKGQEISKNRSSKQNQIRFSRLEVLASDFQNTFQEFLEFLMFNKEKISLYKTSQESSASLDIVGDLVVGSPRPSFFYSIEVLKILSSLNCAFNIEIYAVNDS